MKGRCYYVAAPPSGRCDDSVLRKAKHYTLLHVRAVHKDSTHEVFILEAASYFNLTPKTT